MGTFDYHITMVGADLDPDQVPVSLSGSVTMSSRRGDASNKGSAREDGFIVVAVDSINQAVSAVREFRALQPDKVEHAECVVGYWFEEQCNLEFSEVELSALVAERVRLSISCYPKA